MKLRKFEEGYFTPALHAFPVHPPQPFVLTHLKVSEDKVNKVREQRPDASFTGIYLWAELLTEFPPPDSVVQRFTRGITKNM